MCGIAGLMTHNGRPPATSPLRAMQRHCVIAGPTASANIARAMSA